MGKKRLPHKERSVDLTGGRETGRAAWWAGGRETSWETGWEGAADSTSVASSLRKDESGSRDDTTGSDHRRCARDGSRGPTRRVAHFR